MKTLRKCYSNLLTLKVISVAIVFLFITCCCKEIPDVTTDDVTNIKTTSATGGGNVADDGGADITERGVAWSTSSEPSLSDSRTSDGSGIGHFTSSIAPLTPNTLYYVKAYATNDIGTGWGHQVSFITETPILATVFTSPIISITSISAESGGNVTDDGGSEVTARGVCWNTSPDPTTSNYKTTDGSGLGLYTSLITGLQPCEEYYIRAYATNSAGTAYDVLGEITFTALADTPTVTTNEINNITQTSAKSGGNVTDDGGAPVTSRGICWSTSKKPTLSNSNIILGSGIGIFDGTITDLLPNTSYYVRAFATNNGGTGYGDQIFFTTVEINVTDIDGNTYTIIQISSQFWIKENLQTTKLNDGTAINNITGNWYLLIDPAYCWYNDNIVYKNPYGALYNWYAVNTGKLCPSGYHVPSDGEWTTLTTFLGGESQAGGKMKEIGTTHWQSPNTEATNESGFTALPGGNKFVMFLQRISRFQSLEYGGYWWSSTEYNTISAWSRYLNNNDGDVNRYYDGKQVGFSVRCLRDY